METRSPFNRSATLRLLAVALAASTGIGCSGSARPEGKPGSVLPALSVADVSVAEGQVGTVRAVFSITLDAAGALPVSANYATMPLTAKEGIDYQKASGTVQLAPGQTSASVTVLVIGNTIPEPDKTFRLVLDSPQGATLARPAATGTIRNDDGLPRTSYEFKRDAPRIDYGKVRAGRPAPGNFVLALCSADYRGQGKLDAVIASGDGSQNTTPIDFFDRAGAVLAYDGALLPSPVPGLVHPRKCVAGDFDGDGHLDIFVARPGSPYLLKGDGHGQFTVATARLSNSLAHLNAVYTAELIDIDADGHLDLFVSGHEQDGLRATIYWGDKSGTFADDRRTYLPAVPGWGVTIDLAAEDLDRDGLRDLVLNRTGDPTGGGFYNGYRVQILRQTAPRVFEDVSDAWAPSLRSDTGNWLVWLQLFDLDGDGNLDIVVNDAGRNLAWLNDGTGHFKP